MGLHVKLRTKTQNSVPKSEVMLKEISRLERANSYIKDEPYKLIFIVRNEMRIDELKKDLEDLLQLSKGEFDHG